MIHIKKPMVLFCFLQPGGKVHNYHHQQLIKKKSDKNKQQNLHLRNL